MLAAAAKPSETTDGLEFLTHALVVIFVEDAAAAVTTRPQHLEAQLTLAQRAHTVISIGEGPSFDAATYQPGSAAGRSYGTLAMTRT